MRRSLKLVLSGLVLLGLLGGAIAWKGTGKTVLLRVDGQDRSVHTTATDVRGVLAAAHLLVTSHDLVAPDLSARVHDKGEVVIRRGHLLHLSIDGSVRDVWVNAASVDEALAQLGFTGSAYVSVSRSRRLDAGVTDLSVTSPRRMTVSVDGRRVAVLSGGPTTTDAVRDAGVALGPDDRVVPAEAVRDGLQIHVQRVRHRVATVRSAIPYTVLEQPDGTQYAGTSTLVRAGRAGTAMVTYQLVYVDGRYAGRVATSTTPVVPAVTEIRRVGTKPAPEFLLSTSEGSPQRIAAGMVLQHGWDAEQFGCLVSLWTKESGWRTDAANPSGAYGIPQALPGSKMSTVGPDWETDAATQITWGLNYIADVYGTPCAAWGHSQATNWY
jgi:uncharacterized protein YabE (DUF348 family)